MISPTSPINSIPLDMGDTDKEQLKKKNTPKCKMTIHCRVLILLVVSLFVIEGVMILFFNLNFFRLIRSTQTAVIDYDWRHVVNEMNYSLSIVKNHTHNFAQALEGTCGGVLNDSKCLNRIISESALLRQIGFVAIYKPSFENDDSLLSYVHYNCDARRNMTALLDWSFLPKPEEVLPDTDDMNLLPPINGTPSALVECVYGFKPGAPLPEMFRASTNNSRMFLKLVTENMDEDGFSGMIGVDAYDNCTYPPIYFYSIVPLRKPNSSEVIGYMLGGGDLRLYIQRWVRSTDGCISLYNTKLYRFPEQIVEGLDRLNYVDIVGMTSDDLHMDLISRDDSIWEMKEDDFRACSPAIKGEYRAARVVHSSFFLTDMGTFFSFFSNSLPRPLINKINTTGLSAAEAKFAQELLNNGAYSRVEITERMLPKATQLAPPVVSITLTMVLLTFVGLYLYLLFAVLRRLHMISQALMETLLSAFDAVDDFDAFAQTQRRKLVEDILTEEEIEKTDGDEIKLVTALADHLSDIRESRLKKELSVLHSIEENNRILLDTYRLVNMFVGRDDEDLKQTLPGLVLNSQENMKRSTLRQMMNGTLVMKKPVEFKTLKQILNNPIATLVFKSFCRKCGLDAYQSFMFLIDVVWLRSIELGAIDRVQDFATITGGHENDKTRGVFLGLDEPGEEGEDTAGNGSSSHLSSGSRTQSFNNLIENSIRPPPPAADDPTRIDSVKSRRSFFKGGRNLDVVPPGNNRLSTGVPLSPLASPVVPQSVGSPPGSPRFKKSAFSKQLPWSPEASDLQKSLSSLPAVNEPMMEKSPSPGDTGDRVKAMFQTEMGRSFAKTMYQAYFGERSLAQRYKQKSALLGCGRSKEYRMLRDSPVVILTPKILEALAEPVTKRLHQDVLPKFQQSFMYKVLLMMVDIEQEIGKKHVESKSVSSSSSPSGTSSDMTFRATPIFRSIWKDVIPSESTP